MNIYTRVKFDAAHYLPLHPGKCRNLHGHTYTVELGIKNLPIDPKTGMSIDFGEVKEWLYYNVVAVFDHQSLNGVMREPPTAENIALYIREKASKMWHHGVVRVFETADCWAEVEW